MTPEQLEHFYEAALTAGAILSGFIGTFLNFRIQREASYYRQPVLHFIPGAREGCGQDVAVSLSHFTSSFALIILAAFSSVFFGVFWPLAALAHWNLFMSGPAPILAGIVGSVVLVGAYFFDELLHYRIICKPDEERWIFNFDKDGWKSEWWIVVGGILLALFLAWWIVVGGILLALFRVLLAQ